MNHAAERNTGLCAIRLLPPVPGSHGGPIAGRVEHVLSGRCHDFVDGAALLACLAFDQQLQQLQDQPDGPGAACKAPPPPTAA